MRKVIFFIVLIILCVSYFFLKQHKESDSHLPLVAIANYGPHASLSSAITGFKNEMARSGFFEGKNIRYQMADVNFSQHLISQMLMGVSANKPKAILVITTPVAETAKRLLQQMPLVYTVVTNPVEARLLKEKFQANANITGSSDSQNLKVFLKEAKRILPNARTVGLLYATSERGAPKK